MRATRSGMTAQMFADGFPSAQVRPGQGRLSRISKRSSATARIPSGSASRRMPGFAAISSRNRPSCPASSGARRPPALAGAALPVSRTRRTSLIAADALTSKRRAASRAELPRSSLTTSSCSACVKPPRRLRTNGVASSSGTSARVMGPPLTARSMMCRIMRSNRMWLLTPGLRM